MLWLVGTYYSKSPEAMGAMLRASGGLFLDGSLVPLGSTATHDPMLIAREAWVRWKSLDATKKIMRMNI